MRSIDRERAGFLHFGDTPDAKAADQAEGALLDCIHHTGERLAAGPDDAETIAKAVVTLCSFEESADVAAKRKQFPGVITLGNASKGEDMFVEEEVRAIVVQSRAAHCGARRNSN